MPFRPPTFRLARCHESSLAASKIVKHGDAPRPQSCPLFLRDPGICRGFHVVAVGSRGLSSLNWHPASPSLDRGGWSQGLAAQKGPAKGRR